jgi:hypothetical protein
MSDKLDSFGLETEIFKWKLQYGERKVSPRGTEYWSIPIDSPVRRNLVETFFRILKEQHGFESKDFDRSLCEKVLKACVNPESKKAKLKEWEESARFDIMWAVASLFPSTPIKETNKKYEGVAPALETKVGESVLKELVKESTPIDKYVPERELLDLSIFPKVEIVQDKNSILEMLEREDNE